MLANLNEVMAKLEARRVMLPGFDIAGGQSDFLLGVLAACEAARCPALLLVWAPGADYVGMEMCADLLRSAAARASVPVIAHLDHAKTEQEIETALKLGFRSVMFDASDRPLEENIRRTRAMVELAHAHGATIEGELGRFGQEESGDGAAELTDPGQAAAFVRGTGVDLLAPAVGNAHGFYKRPPQLRWDLIEAIATAAGVPLSLHGGTGLPIADLLQAAKLGVRKLNIATQLHKDFSDALVSAAGAGDPKRSSWRKILQTGRDAIRQTAGRYISDLGAGGLV